MRKNVVFHGEGATRFIPDRVLKTRGGGLSVVSVEPSRLRNLAIGVFLRANAGFIRDLKNRSAGQKVYGLTGKPSDRLTG
jgi:hypothetical protein